jgi:PAS domain S-box-containing protein
MPQRRAAETASKMNPASLFRSLFIHMNEGAALHELVLGEDGAPENYRILAVNPRYAQILGIDVDQAVGRLGTEVYGVPEAPYLKEFAEVALSGQAMRLETYFPPMAKHFEISVAPLETGFFATIFTDITQRRRDEEALRRSEDRFNRIFQFVPDVLMLADTEGRLVDVNEAFCQIAGCSREQAVGRTTAEVGLWAEGTEVGPLVRTLREAGKVDLVDVKVAGPNGKPLTLQLSARRVAFEDRELYLWAGRDITEARRLEGQLLQAQKMESLGVLAGGIAHDFNNLLTGILGNADMALIELSSSSAALVNLDAIGVAARRAAELCRQLLAYSGKGRFVVQAVDLRELVEEMLHLLQLSISKKAVLKLNFASGLPAVEADATQLRQIIMNLIVNASDAIGDRSGVISVTTGAVHCDAAYLRDVMGAANLQPGLYVALEVSDTGCGIERAALPRIFDPFYSTKFTGRGLGLAAVVGILRSHKGGIKVYTEPGKGSCFKVLLPPSNAVAQALQPSAVATRAWTGTGTILLADDEETVRALGRRMLEKVGFKVIDVTDGREALTAFEAHKDEIRCVILDLTMPHVDGEACFREMRRMSPDVRVILSSGYNEQEVVSRFVGKGLAGFVQKPYTLNELLTKLREVLEP